MLWCWQDTPAWLFCSPAAGGAQPWAELAPTSAPTPRTPLLSLLMVPGVTSLPQPGLPLPIPVQLHAPSDAPALHSSSCKVEEQERSLWCPILTNSACTGKPQQPRVLCVWGCGTCRSVASQSGAGTAPVSSERSQGGKGHHPSSCLSLSTQSNSHFLRWLITLNPAGIPAPVLPGACPTMVNVCRPSG